MLCAKVLSSPSYQTGGRAERPEEEGPELVHVVLRADPSDGASTAPTLTMAQLSWPGRFM